MNKRKEIEPYWFGLVLCLEKQPVLQVCHLYQKKTNGQNVLWSNGHLRFNFQMICII